MAKTTEHIARKARECGEYPRCSHGIEPGQRYRRYIAFPGDEGHEHGERPRVMEVCAGCAAAGHRPITGARIEVFILDRGEPVVTATGVITETRYLGGGVDTYVVTDAEGKQHEASPHRINVLAAVDTVGRDVRYDD